MSVTNRYREAWEGFWREAPEEQGEVFWDAEPVLTAAHHLALFEPYLLDHRLTLVDLGCGNGTQTRYFAERFPRVVGADLSGAAIGHARRADPGGLAAYRVLDAVDKADMDTLCAELGDANVYVRGVLHQSAPEDRQPLMDGIASLVGARGRVFVVELSEDARPVLRDLAARPGGPPPKLAPVLRHGIAPGEMPDHALPEHLGAAGLTVLADGELALTTTESQENGTRVALPSRWYVAGRAV